MKNSLCREAPNIVYILADDMGYGDLSCLNPDAKIHTRHLDEMASNGMYFRDAHSTSAVCTPSRYSILTGRYNWRSWLKEGVVFGYDKPVIEKDMPTVAGFLKTQGYETNCIGKWHLGWNWTKTGPKPEDIDYTGPITGGPVDCGFDRFHGLVGSPDMPPYVYIRDRHPTAVPDRMIEENDDFQAYWRPGPIAPDFDHMDCLPQLTRRAVDYIKNHKKSEKPYFLYFPIGAPHTPILPTPAFQGKSGLNPYADFCLMVDDTVRQIREAVAHSGTAENTLIVFTSDNGCSPRADFEKLAEYGHNPSHVFRGHKADIYEGGHRIPLIMEWPAVIQAGSATDEIVCLSDFFATCADFLNVPLAENEAVDSVSTLSLLQGEAKAPVREATVHHSFFGAFAIRKGKWKFEMCPGSGGWSRPRPGKDDDHLLPPVQLYNLEDDIGENRNLEAEYPEVVKELQDDLSSMVRRGRSTPGPDQPNTGNVEWPQLWWMLSRTPE
ncbi:arylsulfatase [Kiritimatiellaeota bacterium B1221]|nr:arylsulfatase [Kiritimatiellaeota bacterium B1221]